MDTMLIKISRLERTKDDDGYLEENEIQFYRQEIPLLYLNSNHPHLMREIIALCNQLEFPKE